MADLKVGIVLGAVDKATAPLKGLSRSAGGTQAALAKLGGQASQVGKLRGLQSQLGGLASKLDLSRRKTSELGRELKRTDSPSEKLRRAFERSQGQTVKLARAHKRQKGALRELSASLRKAGVDTRRLGSEQERLERTSERLRRRLGRLRQARAGPRAGGISLGRPLAALGAYAGGGALLRAAGGFLGTASRFETLEATLTTLEGSGGKARESMAWIRDFTSRTPYELGQVSESFARLRAYGMDPTSGLLRDLGDTASAMGKDVMQAVEAIADAVTGENERLKEFGIKARTDGDTITYEYTDRATGEARTATASKRDRAEIQRVLRGIMAANYGGAMGDRMKTFEGMMSNLRDRWTEFQSMVMDSGPFEALKQRLGGLLGSFDAMADSGELQKLADRLGEGLVQAFEAFEQDIWPALTDEVWPALKDIAGAVGDVLEKANGVAKAFGGWGNVLKAFAAYKVGGLALGAGRRAIGAGRSAWGLAGDLKDAATGPVAKRLRGRLGGLGRSAFGVAKTGAGKAASGLASLGRTLGSLTLRFAPLALGALKAVGAAVAGLSLPVTATVAAIAGAAYLIWKHWEPIKGFFAKLWEGVKAAVSSAWEKLKSIDWSGIGLRLLSTLADGLRSAGSLVWDALKATLGTVADLLPGSDARTGPLSELTASGSAIMATLGEGVRRSGASSLQRPLSRALATAAAGLALAPPAVQALQPPGLPDRARPSLEERLRAATRPPPVAIPVATPAAPPGQPAARIVHHHYRITIHQLPGEDPRALADRVTEEIERRQRQARREGQYDAY